MILRRLFFLIFVLGFTVPCFAQKTIFGPDKQFTTDVLKTSLFAKTDNEKAFCDHVIAKRDDGSLPHWIVYGVYRKAVTKDTFRRFAYFKSGLEIVCEREGIVLNPTQSATSLGFATQFFSSIKNIFKKKESL